MALGRRKILAKGGKKKWQETRLAKAWEMVRKILLDGWKKS